MCDKCRISRDRDEKFYARLVTQKLVDFLSDERKCAHKTDETMDQSASASRTDSPSRDSVQTAT